VPEAGAVELVALAAFAEFALVVAFASSWNKELCVIVREEMTDSCTSFRSNRSRASRVTLPPYRLGEERLYGGMELVWELGDSALPNSGRRRA
jgi:hypothetical protein